MAKKKQDKKPRPIKVPVKKAPRERREKYVPIEDEDFPSRISYDDLKNLL